MHRCKKMKSVAQQRLINGKALAGSVYHCEHLGCIHTSVVLLLNSGKGSHN